MLVAGIKEGEG
jgi:hypothetical protein